ncbi:transposase [Oceanisphaera profunda]|uniref:Transposase n=1 Tax=Oceanisphaera profunda TaxID=1416627 RepID=A0A1Y0D2Q8_9GAMM|nr:transposase [Oceanisphaera profunda]ART81799.1 transposase [Oceanisphaera profunda]
MTYHNALTGRISIPLQIYHITICTHQRTPLFRQLRTGRMVVQELKYIQDYKYADSLAWVIMPDHLHWLMQLNETASLSSVLKRFKGRTTSVVNRHLQRTGALWQKGFNEHALRKEEDIKQIARYIVANPLRANLVSKVGDYPLWDAIWL